MFRPFVSLPYPNDFPSSLRPSTFHCHYFPLPFIAISSCCPLEVPLRYPSNYPISCSSFHYPLTHTRAHSYSYTCAHAHTHAHSYSHKSAHAQSQSYTFVLGIAFAASFSFTLSFVSSLLLTDSMCLFYALLLDSDERVACAVRLVSQQQTQECHSQPRLREPTRLQSATSSHRAHQPARH